MILMSACMCALDVYAILKHKYTYSIEMLFIYISYIWVSIKVVIILVNYVNFHLIKSVEYNFLELNY